MNSEAHILEMAVEAFRQASALDAEILQPETDARPYRIEVQADGRRRRFVVEVRSVDRLAVPALVQAQHAERDEPPLLVAPYISREIAEKCRDLGLGFIDTAGNAYLKAPGLLI